MRKIVKGQEPDEMSDWKRAHPNGRYSQIDWQERIPIKTACIEEQHNLCAYCCKPITLATSHNEHVEAQRIAPTRTMDFSNIVASCNSRRQCGDSHGSQPLTLTPLIDECETELEFSYSGRVTGLTPRARQGIDVLKLDCRALNRARSIQIDALLYESGVAPHEVAELDAELITLLLQELAPQNGEALKPYAPVLVNVLQHELKKLEEQCV